MRPDDRIKVALSLKICPKSSLNSVYLISDIKKSIKSPDIEATFAQKIVTITFQKRPNLVTLA